MLRAAAALALALSFSVAHADLLDRRDGLVYDTVTNLTWDISFDVASRLNGGTYDRRFALDVLGFFLRSEDYKGVATWTHPNTVDQYQSLFDQSTPAQLAGLRTDHPYWTGEGLNASTSPPAGYWIWYDFATGLKVYEPIVNLQETAWVLPVAFGDIAAPVPEASTLAMFLGGLGVLYIIGRRRSVAG